MICATCWCLHKMRWTIFIFSTYFFITLQLHKCTKVIQNKLRSKWKSSFFFCSVLLLFFFFPPPKKEVICFNLWKWVLRTIKLRMDSFLNLGYRAIFYRSLLKWVSFKNVSIMARLSFYYMYYYGLRAFFHSLSWGMKIEQLLTLLNCIILTWCILVSSE